MCDFQRLAVKTGGNQPIVPAATPGLVTDLDFLTFLTVFLGIFRYFVFMFIIIITIFLAILLLIAKTKYKTCLSF